MDMYMFRQGDDIFYNSLRHPKFILKSRIDHCFVISNPNVNLIQNNSTVGFYWVIYPSVTKTQVVGVKISLQLLS